MASITIRNLDDKLKARLRIRAARHGRSMEEEARVLLRESIAADSASPIDLAAAVAKRFRGFGDVELELPAREAMRPPPKLDSLPGSRPRSKSGR